MHNGDFFGDNRRVVPQGIPYQTASWAWLLEPRWQGKVAVVNNPAIGLFDLTLAAQGAGWMVCEDIGRMTRGEIDQIFARLLPLKQRGQFRGAWGSVPASVEMM